MKTFKQYLENKNDITKSYVPDSIVKNEAQKLMIDFVSKQLKFDEFKDFFFSKSKLKNNLEKMSGQDRSRILSILQKEFDKFV